MRSCEEEAMEILMLFGKGGHVMDSGGKDSTVLKEIAYRCHEKYGLQYDIVHNHTTIDAPETVYFVRAEREREDAESSTQSNTRLCLSENSASQKVCCRQELSGSVATI